MERTHTTAIPCYGLKIAIIVLGAFGMVLWGCAIGFPLGFAFERSEAEVFLLGIALMLVNVGYIYYTARIIYSITSATFPSVVDFRDVRGYCSKLIASTVVGLALWIVATVFFVRNKEYAHEIVTTFGCSFTFLWTVLIVCLTSCYEAQVSTSYLHSGQQHEENIPLEYHPGSHQYPSSKSESELYMPNRFNSRPPPHQQSRAPVHGGHVAPWADHM